MLGFTGKTLDGEPFDAAALAGKPALLWFWAPWCATCAAQAGSVTDVQAEYGDRLGVLGIAGMGDNADMHEFVTDSRWAACRNLDDEAGVLWKKFGITEQSTYVLVDRAGKIVTTGYLDDLRADRQGQVAGGVSRAALLLALHRRDARRGEPVRVRAAARVPVGAGRR